MNILMNSYKEWPNENIEGKFAAKGTKEPLGMEPQATICLQEQQRRSHNRLGC